MPLITEAEYRVFYLPISIETYTPVAPSDIDKKSHFDLSYKSDYLDKLYLLREDDKKTDVGSLNIRAKIVRKKDGKVIYLAKPQSLYSGDFKRLDGAPISNSLIYHFEAKTVEACSTSNLNMKVNKKRCRAKSKIDN